MNEGTDENMNLPGLAAFTGAQRGFFFGREREIEQLLGLLEASRTGPHRWVQIEGPRGVGKTSLVHAGLLPRLAGWRILSARPAELLELLDAPVEERAPEGCLVLVVLEAWEDLALLGGSQRRWLDERLSTALTQAGSRLRLLTTLREDSLHLLEPLPRLAHQLNAAARYALRPLEAGTLVRVIREMAGRSGLTLPEGLPERMVRETANTEDALPLIAQALREFQAPRDGPGLTLERYEALGGVGRALGQRAEKLLADLGPTGLERARGMVLSLIELGRGQPARPRSRPQREVLAAAGGDAGAEDVLRHLSTAPSLPLLRVSEGPEHHEPRVALIQEALLRQVPTLVRWLDEERTRQEHVADLETTVHAWEQAGRPRRGLATGALLEHYLESARTPAPHGAEALAPRESTQGFLTSSRRFAHQKTALWVAGAVFLLSTTAWALWAQHRAEAQRERLFELTRAFAVDADGRLGRRAYTLEPRRELLARFTGLLGELSPRDQDSLSVLRTRIAALHRRADLAFHDESLSATHRLLDEAGKAIRRGQEEHPDEPGLAFDAGLNAARRGERLLLLGRLADARGLFTEALAHFDRLPVGFEPETQRRLIATSSAALAEMDLLEEHPIQALRGYEGTILALEQSAQASLPEGRSLLVELRGARAEATHRAGDAVKAAERFDSVLKEARGLTDVDPTDSDYQRVRARVLLQAAAFRVARGEFDEAVKLYREALPLARVLHAGELPNKRHGLLLTECLLGLERLRSSAADGTAVPAMREERCGAVKEFRRQDPEDPRFRSIACE